MKSTMKSAVRRTLTTVLALVVILSISMPALAAGQWYTYQCGCNRTRTMQVRVTRGSRANYWLTTTLLSQKAGSVNMRHSLTRRQITTSALGTYYVTVTQTRDAYNRPVYKRVCTNRFWAGQRFNIALTAGTYTVSVRSVGVYYSLSKALVGYSMTSWHAWPMYKIGA